jgi:hypothetical protein
MEKTRTFLLYLFWVRPTILKPADTLIKKKRKFSLFYKEIQKGWGAKSYVTIGLLIYSINMCAFPHISNCNENPNYVFLSPNFYIHVSVSDLYTVVPGSVYIFPAAE